MAVLLSVGWFGARDDLWPALLAGDQILLFKLAFTTAVVAIALPLVRDLSIPGKRLRPWPVSAAIFLFLVAILALWLHGPRGTPAGAWVHQIDHGSWIECIWKIPALAVPALVLLGAGARYLAPTRLALAGALIGVAAGGIGAIGYALHCHDNSIAFVLASYTLAILETTLIGRVAGPFMLRWASSFSPKLERSDIA
jgi:hypothetical protein